MDYIRGDNGWSPADWVGQALKHADDMAQADLSRQLQARGLKTVDKSAVNKILKGERRLMGDEMLAISAITGFPMPRVPGVQPPLLPMRNAPPGESAVEKAEKSRSTGQVVVESHLRQLMAKVLEMPRPRGMTPVLADNLAAGILSVCRRPPDQQEDDLSEDRIAEQARALAVLYPA